MAHPVGVTSKNNCVGTTTPLFREEVVFPQSFRCLCSRETSFLLLEPEIEGFSWSSVGMH